MDRDDEWLIYWNPFSGVARHETDFFLLLSYAWSSRTPLLIYPMILICDPVSGVVLSNHLYLIRDEEGGKGERLVAVVVAIIVNSSLLEGFVS